LAQPITNGCGAVQGSALMNQVNVVGDLQIIKSKYHRMKIGKYVE
jgi:hypothetical protein